MGASPSGGLSTPSSSRPSYGSTYGSTPTVENAFKSYDSMKKGPRMAGSSMSDSLRQQLIAERPDRAKLFSPPAPTTSSIFAPTASSTPTSPGVYNANDPVAREAALKRNSGWSVVINTI